MITSSVNRTVSLVASYSSSMIWFDTRQEGLTMVLSIWDAPALRSHHMEMLKSGPSLGLVPSVACRCESCIMI